MFWPNCRAEGSNRTGLFRDTPKTAQNHGFGLKTMVFGVKTMVSGVGVFGPPSRTTFLGYPGGTEKTLPGWSKNHPPDGQILTLPEALFLSAPKGSKR